MGAIQYMDSDRNRALRYHLCAILRVIQSNVPGFNCSLFNRWGISPSSTCSQLFEPPVNADLIKE